jgi:hypothetical protein
LTNGIDPDGPYSPPTARLISPSANPSSRWGWKLYLWLMVGLTFLILPVFFYMTRVQVFDLLDIGQWVVSSLAIFGYAYRRRLFRESFWRAWLPLTIAWDSVLLLVLMPAGLAYAFAEGEPAGLGENLITFLLDFPEYVALFLYGFRSPGLWRDRLDRSEAQ